MEIEIEIDAAKRRLEKAMKQSNTSIRLLLLFLRSVEESTIFHMLKALI
jgi:hypothetical protein